MYSLAWAQSFKRGFKKATKNKPELQEKIFSVLEMLSLNPFDPKLKTLSSLLIAHCYTLNHLKLNTSPLTKNKERVTPPGERGTDNR